MLPQWTFFFWLVSSTCYLLVWSIRGPFDRSKLSTSALRSTSQSYQTITKVNSALPADSKLSLAISEKCHQDAMVITNNKLVILRAPNSSGAGTVENHSQLFVCVNEGDSKMLRLITDKDFRMVNHACSFHSILNKLTSWSEGHATSPQRA